MSFDLGEDRMRPSGQFATLFDQNTWCDPAVAPGESAERMGRYFDATAGSSYVG